MTRLVSLDLHLFPFKQRIKVTRPPEMHWQERRRHVGLRWPGIAPDSSNNGSLASRMPDILMLILFLDFDGVLHPEFCRESKHFVCEPYLISALEGIDVEIVVSSTWRTLRPLDEIRARLSAAVASRIVGATARYSQLADVPSRLALYEREAECVAWLKTNRPAWTRWLAVDDRAWLFRPFCANLFLVDGKRGLTEGSSSQLRARLTSTASDPSATILRRRSESE